MMADLNLNFRCNRVNCPSCPIGDWVIAVFFFF
jgi:hypothetical protein